MHGDHIEYPSHALIDPNSKISKAKINLMRFNVVSDLKINQSFE